MKIENWCICPRMGFTVNCVMVVRTFCILSIYQTYQRPHIFLLFLFNMNDVLGAPKICWFDPIQENVLRSFRFMTRTLIPPIAKLFVSISDVSCEYLRRQRNVHPSNSLEDGDTAENVEVVNEHDQVLPCVQRLEKLEKLLEELKNKPAEIPLEKDQMLQQSMERIKSVESDLENTKRVSINTSILLTSKLCNLIQLFFLQILHATVMKQLEIDQLLENLRQTKHHVSDMKFLFPMSVRP